MSGNTTKKIFTGADMSTKGKCAGGTASRQFVLFVEMPFTKIVQTIKGTPLGIVEPPANRLTRKKHGRYGQIQTRQQDKGVAIDISPRSSMQQKTFLPTAQICLGTGNRPDIARSRSSTPHRLRPRKQCNQQFSDYAQPARTFF